MTFFHKTLLTLTLITTSQIQAQSFEPFTPESGFWWNPDESGSGYSIEIQDNYLFVALYVYDDVGNPIWYTAGTSLEGNALFDSQLDYTYGGTCIDCSYTAPISILGERGPITIEFITETTATIQFQGVVKNIERFNFLLGDETTRMLGEWQTIIDFSSTGASLPYIGDILIFDITTVYEGRDYVEGCRPDNSIDGFCSDFALNRHYVYSAFDYDTDILTIVVDDSDNLLFYYELKLGLNQFDGEVEVVLKEDGSSNGVKYPVRGFRTASRSFVETGVGPNLKTEAVNKINDKVIGVRDIISNMPPKPLSSFNEKEQAKILKRQAFIEKIKEKIKNSKKAER